MEKLHFLGPPIANNSAATNALDMKASQHPPTLDQGVDDRYLGPEFSNRSQNMLVSRISTGANGSSTAYKFTTFCATIWPSIP